MDLSPAQMTVSKKTRAQPESSTRRQDSSRSRTEVSRKKPHGAVCTTRDAARPIVAPGPCFAPMRTSVAPTATAGSSEFCGDPISGVAAKDRIKEKVKIQDRRRPQVLRGRPPKLPIQPWKSFASFLRSFAALLLTLLRLLKAARPCCSAVMSAKACTKDMECASGQRSFFMRDQPSRGRDCHPYGAIRSSIGLVLRIEPLASGRGDEQLRTGTFLT